MNQQKLMSKLEKVIASLNDVEINSRVRCDRKLIKQAKNQLIKILVELRKSDSKSCTNGYSDFVQLSTLAINLLIKVGDLFDSWK